MSVDKEETVPDPDGPPAVGSEAAEDEAPQTPPEKKVVVNEDPQFFDLDPNSTDVKPVEKPPPSSEKAKAAEPCPPPIDQSHLDKIIADTLGIIEETQKQSYDQKLGSQKLAFMLTCIRESICMHRNFVEKMNAFLVNNERLQSIWFCKYRNSLKCFGDYTLVLKDNPETVKVDNLPNPVPEKELKSLADEVVSTLYAGGTEVSAQRVVCKSINGKLDAKREFAEEHMAPFESWFILLNKAASNQNAIVDLLFKVSAHISFLKTGEACDSLMALELDKELEALEKPKSS